MTDPLDPLQDPDLQNVRVTLRLHPTVVKIIDDLNEYIPQGDRPDMVRFLMSLGIKQMRMEQTAKVQSEHFGNVAGELKAMMEVLNSAVEQPELPLSQAKTAGKKPKAKTVPRGKGKGAK